jgi:hypothetical protein
MICKPCRDGAKAAEAARSLAFDIIFGDTDNPITVADVIRDYHEACPGDTWCDCQHASGSSLNLALISTSNKAK